jgi:hypothetical protein
LSERDIVGAMAENGDAICDCRCHR